MKPWLANFRFYEELNDFLPPENHKQSIAYRCSRCHKIYWSGSHVVHMSGAIHQLLER